MPHPNRSITIYTDGGADPNPGPGGWGVVLIHGATDRIKELSGGDPDTTNNRMELTAAIRALESRHEKLAREAASHGAGLVVFPELSLTGYFIKDLVTSLALRRDSPELRPLLALSRDVA